jgi:Flp pilus assembly protein TadG
MSKRKGIATLELALCLPLLLILFLGTVDCCSMIYLKQSMSLAVYEGSRVAQQEGATAEEVASACEDLLSSRGVQRVSVSTQPADLSAAQPGELVEVNVSVSGADVSLFLQPLAAAQTFKGSFVTMRPTQGYVDELLEDNSTTKFIP